MFVQRIPVSNAIKKKMFFTSISLKKMQFAMNFSLIMTLFNFLIANNEAPKFLSDCEWHDFKEDSLNGFVELSTTLNNSSEEAFTEIYNAGTWGRNEQGEGTSGGGSLPQNTEVYRSFLQEFIDSHEIQSVVDVGCGDWSFSQLINWGKVDYIGYDVVKPLIERNQLKFTKPNIHFLHGDATTIELPPADLLICKDVLQHLSNQDILSFIPQFSKFKYCIITNDVDSDSLTSNNSEIQSGGYRVVDLTQPPFNIKGNISLIYKGGFNIKQVLLIDSHSE